MVHNLTHICYFLQRISTKRWYICTRQHWIAKAVWDWFCQEWGNGNPSWAFWGAPYDIWCHFKWGGKLYFASLEYISYEISVKSQLNRSSSSTQKYYKGSLDEILLCCAAPMSVFALPRLLLVTFTLKKNIWLWQLVNMPLILDIEEFTYISVALYAHVTCTSLKVRWVTFHSGYDFGYLLKVVTGEELPAGEEEFFDMLRVCLGPYLFNVSKYPSSGDGDWVLFFEATLLCAQIYFPNIYDIKYLMKFCDNLHGGLNKVAEALQVQRIGPQHQVRHALYVPAQEIPANSSFQQSLRPQQMSLFSHSVHL